MAEIMERSNSSSSSQDFTITLFLTVEKQCYQPGATINGTVYLYVPPSAQGCTDYEGIHLRFGGQESILDYTSTTTGTMLASFNNKLLLGAERLSEKFLAIDTPLKNFPSNTLNAGQFEYPFYWKLPDSLPCSMSCCGHKDNNNNEAFIPCELSYNLAAYLLPKDKSDYKKKRLRIFRVVNCVKPIRISALSSSSLSIVCSSSENDETTTTTTARRQEQNSGIICEPQTKTVRSHVLKNKGTIEIGMESVGVVSSNNSSSSSNCGTITIGITGRNQSSIPIEGLTVKLIETVEWGIGGGEYERCKTKTTLAEHTISNDVDVDHQLLPACWQVNPNKKKNRQQRQHANDDASTAGDKILIPLQLERPFRDSYKGKWMDIYHSLQVTVVTKGRFVTNPKLKRMIIIQRQSNSSIPVMATVVKPMIPENKANNLHVPLQPSEIPQAVAVSVDDPIQQQLQNYYNEEPAQRLEKHGGGIQKKEATCCNSFSLLSRGNNEISSCSLDQHPCAVQVQILEPEFVMTIQQ